MFYMSVKIILNYKENKAYFKNEETNLHFTDRKSPTLI